MNDPDTTRAMVGAVDAPKRVPATRPDFAADVGRLAQQLDDCVRTLHAIVNAHTDAILILPPHGGPIATRGHGIWRARVRQLRQLHAYYAALARSDTAAAATVSMDLDDSFGGT